MLKIENTKVYGFEEAVRGMRNPMNSWAKSDSYTSHIGDEQTNETAMYEFFFGEKDKELAMKLSAGGPVHGKFKRMITVYCDITAPLYWWKEFDTYKVGTVANSCSTMHKIHAKEFTRDDFSCEHLITREQALDSDPNDMNAYDSVIFLSDINSDNNIKFDMDHDAAVFPMDILDGVIDSLNACRETYLNTKDKKYWWQMIQLLPSSYNQRRTVMMNYEVLTNIYKSRRDHKLDEWHTLCDWIEQLPDSDLITGVLIEKREDKIYDRNDILNLLTEMAINGATNDELDRVIDYSVDLLLSERTHRYTNLPEAAKRTGIGEFMEKYLNTPEKE